MILAAQFFAALIGLAAMLAMAFALEALARWIAVRRAGIAPAPAAQIGHDLVKLLRKRRLRPAFASPLYSTWPILAFAATGAAACILPGFADHLITQPLARLPLLVGLLALGRAARVLAALESGGGARGRAAAQAATGACLAEAVWLIAMAALAVTAQSLSISRIGAAAPGGPQVLVPAGFAALIAARGFRDDAATDYAGPDRAIFIAESMLRQVVLLAALIDVAVPFGMADARLILSWPLGLAIWIAKLVVLLLAATLAADIAPRRTARLALPLAFVALAMVFADNFSWAGLLIAIGGIFVVFGVVRLWRRAPPLEAASFTQAGAALIGFGLGAAEAGWLILAGIVLARLAGFLAERHKTAFGRRWIEAGCMTALAGLPPFGLFAGDFAVLRAAFAASLPFGICLTLVLAISAILLMARLSPGAAPRQPKHAPAVLAAAALLLALLVALGVAPSLIGGAG
ncbi:hypothetical protein AiwAL_00990 [Acidiphilium sp. AL]|uniref:hypothetical protein n=1 Tax=Acidiphilium sp. AL TaxID=2871704 RepID=UPI0021CB3298|nr:hypothetical protein [Acidiphilium sp. AL]MCU4158681.1 hypothetical protein [Acidiphilium sp. AL]